MIYELVTFYGRKHVNDMMHAADIFMSNRALVEKYEVLEVNVESDTADGDASLSVGAMRAIINKRRVDLEKAGMVVTAAFFRGHAAGCFIDNTVQTTSTGKQWGMLEAALKAYGCPLEYKYDIPERDTLPITPKGNRTMKPRVKAAIQ